MLDDEGNFSLSYLITEPRVIIFEVKSKHINKIIYNCYVQYNANLPEFDDIEDHCCNCPNGVRTTRSYSHIAALI